MRLRPGNIPPTTAFEYWAAWIAGVSLAALAVLWPALGWTQPGTHASSRPASPPSTTAAPDAVPPRVDLGPAFTRWGLTARRQGKRNTCSVFTLTGALEFAAANQQQRGERFSIEFLNWAANRIAGEDVDGGFFSDLWNAFAKYGICREATFPYRDKFEPALAPTIEALAEAKARLSLGLHHHWIKEWNVQTGLTDAQVLEIKRTLAQGWPVCGGFRWPKHAQWTNHTLQMCAADAVFDGHSVLLVGYRDEPSQPGGGLLLFRNSGNDGCDASMPYDYARTYMNDAIWIESGPPFQAGRSPSKLQFQPH